MNLEVEQYEGELRELRELREDLYQIVDDMMDTNGTEGFPLSNEELNVILSRMNTKH